MLVSIHNKQMQKEKKKENNGARALMNQSIKSGHPAEKLHILCIFNS